MIFIIRTQGSPFNIQPSRVLTITSLAVVFIAGALPFMPVATLLGFVAPPPQFFLILLAMLLCYLVAVEWIKQLFYRFFAAH